MKEYTSDKKVKYIAEDKISNNELVEIANKINLNPSMIYDNKVYIEIQGKFYICHDVFGNLFNITVNRQHIADLLYIKNTHK